MRYFRFATIIGMALLIAACGRRLPDEYFTTNTDRTADDVAAETVSETDTPDTTDEMATDDEVVTDTEPVAESTEVASDTSGEDSTPQTQLVEVPPDPIVELVANADPANGEVLVGSGVACTSCHLLDSENMLVGPGFLNLPQRAETRVEGQVAESYIYTSITHPNEHIVEGFSPNLMPPTYGDTYTDEQIYDIIAYLMTLGDYPEREPQYMEVPVDTSSDSEPVAEETEAVVDSEPVAEETEIAEDTQPVAEETAVVAETPVPADDEVVEATEEVSEPVEVVIPEPDPNLDLSGVPSTVDLLAERGLSARGEELFNETLVSGTSCATCHSVNGNPTSTQTDVSYIGTFENAPAYAWASIFSTDMHPAFAAQYETTLTGADTAHIVAYLISLSE